ncbi:MAG: ectoine/hydroxyectoine ABC transporter substrate-binding protein EhuB [Acidimicrobiales bacterium]|nr:ectoine/hydroxyectoine ABC transporter substrate-binding protein EhuB [Acidimicrobiales bacterium]
MSASALSRRRRSWLRFLALFAALGLIMAACGDDDDTDTATDDTSADEGGGDGLLAELQEAGTIQVGIANEVPYGYEDEEGNVTGEAPEVARAVFAELGVDNIEATVVDFGALISGLQAGQFDMIAAGMYINEERAEQILFSDPDYCVGESFAVPEGNPDDLSDFQSVVDNPDVTIAILEGAVEVGYADTAGVPDSQIELFSDVNAQYDALEAGRVDAVTGTYLTVKQQTDALDGFEPVASFTPVDENGEDVLGCGGFGFRTENQELRDAFNDQLNEMQENGELVDIITEFGFAEEDVLLAQDLTVEDLTG